MGRRGVVGGIGMTKKEWEEKKKKSLRED